MDFKVTAGKEVTWVLRGLVRIQSKAIFNTVMIKLQVLQNGSGRGIFLTSY
jgi:hypothetical protein